MQTPPKLSFSGIKLKDLRRYFQLNRKEAQSVFTDWFAFEYKMDKQTNAFLKQLIHKHRYYIPFYNEEELKTKFIVPILNHVDFMEEPLRDWYEQSISYTFEHLKLGGSTDYMVAIGIAEPEMPYFFIQEFKSATPDKHPLIQLLAELITSIALNQNKVIRGAYIIGQLWTFVVVEKVGEKAYTYATSKDFNSLELPDLTQIYTNLQAVKHKYCNIPLNQ